VVYAFAWRRHVADNPAGFGAVSCHTPGSACTVALGEARGGKHSPRFHLALARWHGPSRGLPWQMGCPLLLSERSDSGLNPRSPPVSGGSTEVHGAQCGCSRSQPRQRRFSQRVLHKRGPEFQAARRYRAQSRPSLWIAAQFRTSEIRGQKYIPDRSSGKDCKDHYQREPVEPQPRSPRGPGSTPDAATGETVTELRTSRRTLCRASRSEPCRQRVSEPRLC